ncbi:50S ribosomal protein L17 [Candidatus Beckwithbacteria bacterium CG23_combo_of_CG06-09_8_20_14_all_34_8]|uniref:50S ribosomal protein L17 n=1 Tax=Candidatus Beckwithbacteria bacterium CG23_combo_of_CG06-09_8_20_14_all_34_8 TaxID=1974497 RepID=A0A2H0B6T1_9BACT|nr:MAG: 50S ribosomal protein L17 [Candidatus Beckwithbacteria bacterium CG23_combo_of_CG06-09_8_20_14_all_34_8]
MRHSIAGVKLNRDSSHRKALMRNQARQLLSLGTIETTITKGKLVISTVEKLLNKAKDGSLHVRRQLRADLVDATLVNKTCEMAKNLDDHSTGMVKMIRLGTRRGDNTMMVRLELTAKMPEKILEKDTKKSANKEKTVKKTAKKTK